jgi:HAD superfamily hydrolase (TIGR01490 family)
VRGKVPMKKQSAQRKCAFFDIDGTLLEGYIIQSFPRYLAKKDFIEPLYPNKIDEIILEYKQGRIDYRKAAETIPRLYALAIKGKHESDVKFWARDFMKTYVSEHIFAYSKQLVSHVRNFVDIAIAVSGSPSEAVEEIQLLGFDYVFGSIFEVEDNVYSGKIVANLILGEEKAMTVMNFSKELNINLSRSIAFGDTDQDAPLLSIVDFPVAVNPNKKLRQICETRKWLILEKEELEDLTVITKLLEYIS